MNLTKKQIDIIISKTKKSLKGYHASLATTLGYFHPVGANWSYHAGWTYEGDLVVTVFGEIQ